MSTLGLEPRRSFTLPDRDVARGIAPVRNPKMVLTELAGTRLPGIDELLTRSSTRRLQAGEVLVEQGQAFRSLVVIERGVLTESVGRDSRMTTVAFHERGEVSGNVFALHAAPDRAPSVVTLADWQGEAPYRLAAVVPSRVVVVDAHQIASLAARHAEWAHLRGRVLHAYAMQQQRREHERLTLSTEERYERLLAERPALAGVLTQREIARYLGISEVTMSRLMTRRSGRTPGASKTF